MPGNPTNSVIEKGSKKPLLSGSKTRTNNFAGRIKIPFLAPFSLFCIALTVRCLYIAVLLEHRIVHFGDAYNFLRSGSALYSAIASSSNSLDFFQKIFVSKPSSLHLLQSMKSFELTDRLLIDGPVYPSYLAFIEWLSGINPYNPAFDSSAIQLCLCNSVMDALACVLVYACGRLAFEKRAAVISALLFAFYPAFVINTQHCYSESFSYFMLCAWVSITLLLSLRHSKVNTQTWLVLGLLSGLLMLSKPAFVMVPPLTAALLIFFHLVFPRKKHFAAAESHSNRKFYLNSLCLISGLIISLGPWLYFNKTASGKYSLFVNRVPSFNLFHGNQLKTDGWLAYPFDGLFPGETTKVIESLRLDAQKAPIDFIGLQFKKIARLWSGVWNEYSYPLFGISCGWQSLFHQLLLFFAVFGFERLLTRSKNAALSRSFKAGLILSGIVLFHFAYIPFEAISRYAVTAMPFVILLASFAIADISKQKQGLWRLLGLTTLSSAVIWELSASEKLSNFLAALLPTNLLGLSPWISWSIGCIGILILIVQTNRIQKSFITLTAGVLVLIVSWFYTTQSNDWREWSVILSSSQPAVTQVIRMPKRAQYLPASNGLCYVIVDLQSQVLAPRLRITLNGHTLEQELIPLAQLQSDNADILQCLSLQAQGMSVDFRSFRQWWAIPFHESELHWNANNEITIEPQFPEDRIRLFGQYCTTDALADADGSSELPSIRSFSYTKAFSTFDNEDPRVLEKRPVFGKTIVPTKSGQSTDLSAEPGRQYGHYRIRFLVPGEHNSSISLIQTNNSSTFTKSFSLPKTGWRVEGSNPYSFTPPDSPLQMPTQLPSGTRFNLACELKELTGNHHNALISLNFTGIDKLGQPVAWNSPWQPTGIPISPQRWIRTTFSDTLPDQILKLDKLQANILLSPFQPDYLFLKRKQALKCTVLVKDMQFRLGQSLGLPKGSADWLIY